MTSIAYGALWIFVFAVPWERLIVLPGLSIITRATGVVALGLTLFAIVVSGRIRRWRTFHVAAFMFVAWVALGPDQTLQGFGTARCVKMKVIVTTPNRTGMSVRSRLPMKTMRSPRLLPT